MLLERDLRVPVARASAAASVEIGQCALDPDTYLAIRPEADAESVRLALDAAQWGFGAWLDGRLVHVSFVASAPAPWLLSLGGPCPVGDDEVVVFETHTAPDVRGRGVSTAVTAEILRFFQGAGYRRMLGFTLPHNAASLRSLDKAGYRPIGVIGWARVGGWWVNFVRTQPGASPPAGRSGHLGGLRLYRQG
ncbi:MAG: GNAT family N-acetyltransferase [Solirubrobacteraceae bacterium]